MMCSFRRGWRGEAPRTPFADENFDPGAVEHLRSRGWDVQTAPEAGLLGRSDAEVLEFAWRDRRAVIAHDPDFGALAILGKQAVIGVVFLRPGHISTPYTIASLEALIESDPDIEPPFIVVVRQTPGEVKVRVRRL